MSSAGETSLVDRFTAAVGKLQPDFAAGNDILGLAVSGGPDSLALLLLSAHAFPGRIAAATVDHMLRPEARTEAQFVANLCAERHIPHRILTPTIPIRGSVQLEARKVRYNLLHSWMAQQNIKWLATAHHADDQLETLIMRVLRGSGIDGMSAIRAKRGEIIRPLLGFSKQQLIAYIASQNITAIDDPSNRDQSFDRVRVRHALSHLEGFDVALASQSAAALDDARAAIDWFANDLADAHIKPTHRGSRLDKHDFPNEILRRLVLKSLHLCDPALSPRGEQLQRTIADLKKGKTCTLGNILCVGGETWTFAPAPKRHN